MTTHDLFLREHAALHSAAVAESDFRLDWMLAEMPENDWRRRPLGLNSLAWLLWHVTQVEDACVAPVVFGVPPLLDEARATQLNVRPGDDYSASKAANELTQGVDLAALRAYRDDVGRRTRVQVAELWPDRWEEPVAEADIRRGAEKGGLSGGEMYLVGKSRESLLCWWAVTHIAYHVGQMGLVRSAFAQER